MKYRGFGSAETQVSMLGLAITGLAHDPAPEAGSIGLIHTAIDHGVNYLDLGVHAGRRRHDALLDLAGRALAGGYRERVRIAAHLPCFHIDSPRDVDRCIGRHLERAGIEHIDVFFLDGLNRDTWPWLRERGVLERLEAARTDGRIGTPGFAFHDQLEVLRGILAGFPHWGAVEFQYSFMDVEHHPGIGGIRHAAQRGLAVIAADPLRDGRLIAGIPGEVERIWEETDIRRTPAEWALRWVWNHPEISTAVCAVSCPADLEAYADLAGTVEAGAMGVREQLVINRVREAYQRRKPLPCAECRACMPCPEDIDIARIFEIYNEGVMFDNVDWARARYRFEQHRIEDCTDCGICARRCGREITIMDRLREVREVLSPDPDQVGRGRAQVR